MKHSKGFTLIELLIVIAIIGMLAAVVITGGAESRKKARDTKRISDIHQIQTALEIVFERSTASPKEYPTSLSDSIFSTTKAFGNGTAPTDPSGATYGYKPRVTSGKRIGYCLGAILETEHTILASAQDVDCDANLGVDPEDQQYTIQR